MDFLKKILGKKEKIRTRIAPSPTGNLHIGTARSALFNYLFAKQNGGKFILRVEDTDKERSNKEFEEDILKGLEWLGIEHDEFYRQSERSKIYKKYLQKLLDEKKAFWCYHTKEELEEEKNKQMANKEAPRHVCNHKHETGKRETKGIIRLKGTDKKIKFNDIVRGDIEYDGNILGDISIAKDENTPLYNFAAVVDDYEMKISHVIRGEDHIPNTPKQILIQEALGVEKPKYAHLPLVLGPDKSKLSKRHGATSVNDYKKEGYLPEAIINFITLLGWNPGDNREMFSIKNLLKEFSLEKIQKGGAVFNINKLNWFNKEYIKNSDTSELAKLLLNHLPSDWKKTTQANKAFWGKIVELEKERLTKLSDIKEGIGFFFYTPKYEKELLLWKEDTFKMAKEHLTKVVELVDNVDEQEFDAGKIKEAVWDYAGEKGRGNVLWPFRVSLTGLKKSPDPFGVAGVLGKEETIARLESAINKLA